MALTASSAPSAISTKPKPRERPVSRSIMTCALITVPNGAKAVCRSSSVVVKGRFPTYRFLLIVIPRDFPWDRATKQKHGTAVRHGTRRWNEGSDWLPPTEGVREATDCSGMPGLKSTSASRTLHGGKTGVTISAERMRGSRQSTKTGSPCRMPRRKSGTRSSSSPDWARTQQCHNCT